MRGISVFAETVFLPLKHSTLYYFLAKWQNCNCKIPSGSVC